MDGKNFTPLEKKQKKEQRAYHAKRRGSWMGVNPVSRIVPNKKAYNRKDKGWFRDEIYSSNI